MLTDVQSELVIAHVDLVPEAVQRIAAKVPNLEREEALGNGCLGLVDAAIRYDHRRGPFYRYAPFRIRGEIFSGYRREHKLGGPNRSQPRVVSQMNASRATSLDGSGEQSLYDSIANSDPPIELQVSAELIVADFFTELDVEPTARQFTVATLLLEGVSTGAAAEQLGVSQRTVQRDIQGIRADVR